jgi:uncharacterized membrane protein YuzA (DUF378 family)
MQLRRKKNQLNALDQANAAIVGIGALNYGLVGTLNFDLVRALLGPNSKATRAAYTLVGASAVYLFTRAAQAATR